MAEIGYYNYYNVRNRSITDRPTSWYQKTVDKYESDELESTSESWEEFDAAEEKEKHDSISNNMLRLLENNEIDIGSDSLLISINPYSFDIDIEGIEDSDTESALINALSKGNSIKNLLHYSINSQNFDGDALTKFKAYSSLKEYTGFDLSQLTLKDGKYYTQDNENILDILSEGIKNSSSVSAGNKDTEFNYVKGLLDTVAKVGWQNISDLDVKIGYSKKQGFFAFGRTYEA